MTSYSKHILRLWVLFFYIICSAPIVLLAQEPADIPWNFHPDCNSILNTGIVAMTCGTSSEIPVDQRYTFGMADLNGALPATGRVDVTDVQPMYHHPAWHIDSIGNVFGLALDNCGNTYVAASSNYSSFFFTLSSIIRYGEIGGGAESIEAAGTIYKIDSLTGQPTVFSVLPQQAFSFSHETCEGAGNFPRNTGPALGNIVFNAVGKQFYVSNFEDGRIYRLDSLGAIVDSYDPFTLDNGAPGTPADITEMPYGMALTLDGTELFFGTPMNSGDSGGGVFAIPLNADGSFVGTVNNSSNPSGATWDNYVGAETLHIGTNEFTNNFFSTSFISDLAFNNAGELLLGLRVGCFGTVHTSYNHGGSTIVLNNNTGLYNTYTGIFYTGGPGTLGNSSESYGGVDYFSNPNGNLEVIASSADMVTDWDGPHGILTMASDAYSLPGAPVTPSSPAGLIGYLPQGSGDPKGIGGDVEVFKTCDCELICPTSVSAAADVETICSGDVFNLTYEIFGVETPVEVTWYDENGNEIDPENISLEHSDCAPATYTYTVQVICLADTENILENEVTVEVYTDDIAPFITTVEEDCFIDIEIDLECMAYLSIVGGIPDIMPGDSGTVVIDVVMNGNDPCATESVELSYDCPYCPTNLVPNAPSLVCSQEEFQLTLDENQFLQNVVWQDEEGNAINPDNIQLEHSDCAPATYMFFVSAICADNSEQSYSSSVEIVVVTDDFSPFIESFEEECEIGINIIPACEEFLTLSGTIPEIMPGDTGIVEFNISHNLAPECGNQSLSLSYNCPECITDTTWLFRATCYPEEIGFFFLDSLKNERGCDSLIYEEVIEEEEDLFAQIEDYNLMLGDSFKLEVLTNFTPDIITWTPTNGLSCDDCLQPFIMPLENVEYTLYLEDENGCNTEVSFRVNVDKNTNYYIPNAFSPNNDGINDIFYIFADASVRQVREFYIYDRWGELLFKGENFQPNDINLGWDGYHRGRLLNPQVLVFHGVLEYIDGRTEFVKGDFTLIR